MAKLAKFLYSTALVVITAWLCSYFTRYGIANWYESFEKPAVTPPNEIFAPVWALIYGLMIVSFYQILTAASSLRQTAGQLFVAQLLLQIIWTFLFFYEGMLGAAFGVIVFMAVVVWQMIKVFKQIRPLAAYLNYPYLLWLCYAGFLNFVFLYAQGAVVEF